VRSVVVSHVAVVVSVERAHRAGCVSEELVLPKAVGSLRIVQAPALREHATADDIRKRAATRSMHFVTLADKNG
jgi:hypothetical protein